VDEVAWSGLAKCANRRSGNEYQNCLRGISVLKLEGNEKLYSPRLGSLGPVRSLLIRKVIKRLISFFVNIR